MLVFLVALFFVGAGRLVSVALLEAAAQTLLADEDRHDHDEATEADAEDGHPAGDTALGVAVLPPTLLHLLARVLVLDVLVGFGVVLVVALLVAPSVVSVAIFL